MKHLQVIVSSFLLLFFSCNGKNKEELNIVLTLSGENKKEIEKVLEYYKHDTAKYKAAIFIVKNIPYHYSYSGWQIDSLKHLKTESIKKGKINDGILDRWKDFDYTQSNIVYDIQTVTSELLIENIEYAFKAWRKRLWARHYTFEDFCQYVLPYRIYDEPLEKWRKDYYERYDAILDSLYKGDDVVEAARVMANYLKAEGFINRTDFNLPHLGAQYLLHNRIGYCRENCDIAIYAMRSVGIPVALDFYEMSPSYNSRHFWNAIVDTNHLAIPFNYTEKEVSRNHLDDRKRGKTYRICFDKQCRLELDSESNNAFQLLREPFFKDVTEEYFPGTFVNIENNDIHSSLLYLSIFTGDSYIPIDVAKTDGKSFHFKGIEQNLVYFPTICSNGKIGCATYPFYLKENYAYYFKPDTKNLTTICLRRKYPLLKGRDFIQTIKGVKIEGSLTTDFRQPVLLYEFNQPSTTNYNIATHSPKTKLRYIRYSAPKNCKIQLSEFYVYEKCNKVPLVPSHIASSSTLDSLHRRNLRLLSDNIWESFYMSARDGEQLVFDFGKPFHIDHMIIIPRNDDNYVRRDDVYELYYHNGDFGWIMLERKRAEADSIIFSGVPSNSLLWLHDTSRGHEERPFYMKYGEQVFP